MICEQCILRGVYCTDTSSPPSASVAENLPSGRKIFVDGQPLDATGVPIEHCLIYTGEKIGPAATAYLDELRHLSHLPHET